MHRAIIEAMSNFNVTILGCGSATPTVRHNPSAQILRHGQHAMLIDCGEGTQLQMRRFSQPFGRLDHIFLSHLHGDHFLGLPGLLSTLSLHNVEGSITVHTFEEGAKILRQLVNFVCPTRSFELHFDIIDPKATALVWEDSNIAVTAFPLRHRVDCVGYRFDEKPKKRHINRPACDFYGVPHYLFADLQAGGDLVLPDGKIVENERLTTAPTPSMSYAYCSDTSFDLNVAKAVEGVHTIYHESTYGDEGAVKAGPRGHSTARQAAIIAREAGAKRLVLGHYSQTQKDPNLLVAQAREEFDGEIIAGDEGLVLHLDA